MTEHTPTPWHEDDTAIFAGGGVLARIPNHPENGKNWKADAAFIVKAVNAHDALVWALKMIASGTKDWEYPFRAMPESEMRKIASEALASLVEQVKEP